MGGVGLLGVDTQRAVPLEKFWEKSWETGGESLSSYSFESLASASSMALSITIRAHVDESK